MYYSISIADKLVQIQVHFMYQCILRCKILHNSDKYLCIYTYAYRCWLKELDFITLWKCLCGALIQSYLNKNPLIHSLRSLHWTRYLRISTHLHGEHPTGGLPQGLLHGQLQPLQVMPLYDEGHDRSLESSLVLVLTFPVHRMKQLFHGCWRMLQKRHSTIYRSEYLCFSIS